MRLLKPVNPCSSCLGWRWGRDGYVPADGSGENGVLVVLEAAGSDEAQEGKPTVGKAGFYLWSNLARVGIEREGFKIHNVLSCQPPKNLLAKMPYEQEVIAHCSPLLDATIAEMQETCRQRGRTFTIVALGRIAMKRIMGWSEKEPILKEDYYAYPFWNEKYQAWVLSAPHPSYLMRGNNHELPIVQFTVQRALEIAEKGLELAKVDYLLDPDPATFSQWCQDYEAAYLRDPENTWLSFDIETPYKQGKDESGLAREDDPDYSILRCSFAWKPGQAVSIPWRAEYRAYVESLFAAPGPKIGWNSENYDVPRISVQMPINGDRHDGMLMWHVLNSALDKGLGFVAPFYCPDIPAWKHLSGDQPAFYNAKDSDIALRCALGIKRDLRKNDLWKVYEGHVVRLNRVLSYMSREGVLLDQEGRKKAEESLGTKLGELEAQMETAIPEQVQKYKVYKKVPKEAQRIIEEVRLSANGLEGINYLNATIRRRLQQELGLIQVPGKELVKQCPNCRLVGIDAAHFKSIGKKRLTTCLTCGKPVKQHCDLDEPGIDHAAGCKKLHHEFRGESENPCAGLKPVKVEVDTSLWAQPLKFKLSNQSLQSYQKALRHQAIVDRRENKITFDKKAIADLVKKYPKDPLYPLILEFREVQKLLGTYIGVTQIDGSVKGGMRTGRDGRIHTSYSHNPSTLRLASQEPNMQNIPSRDSYQRDLVKNLIVAGAGNVLIEYDFSAIEAVLVGYFAGDPSYIRLAKMGIHSYLASHLLGRPADLSWSDGDLVAYFKEIKKSEDEHVQHIYNGSKRAIHLCLGPDHEVLTPEGWVRLDALDDHTKVAQWRPSGEMEFVYPEKVTRDPFDGELVSWYGRSLSLNMTEDHRIPFFLDTAGPLHTRHPDEVPETARIPSSGTLVGGEAADWRTIQLALAAQADATITSKHTIRFHLHRQRKILRLREILSHLPLTWHESSCKHGNGVFISVNVGTLLWKWWNPLLGELQMESFINLPKEQKRAVLEEVLEWDGSRVGHTESYLSKQKVNVDVLQALAHTSGSQALIRPIEVDGTTYWRISFNCRTRIRKAMLERSRVRHSGKVYCVTVPSSYFLVRHDDRVCVTGNSGYGGTPHKMHLAEPDVFKTVKDAERLQGIYFDLFPLVPRWQQQIRLMAEKDGFLRNPFGYVHRFHKVFKYEKVGGKWNKKPDAQGDGNKCLAFLPQSTAAGIIKEVMLRLYESRFEEAGRFLRLQIHDSLLLEVGEGEADRIGSIVKSEMIAPVPELALPASWGMGEALSIGVEGKRGVRWGSLR